jgi:hypothetical protein
MKASSAGLTFGYDRFKRCIQLTGRNTPETEMEIPLKHAEAIERILYPKQNALMGESKEEAKPTVVANTVTNSCSSSSSLTAPSYG